MDLWLARLVLNPSSLSSPSYLPSASSSGVRVSYSFFFICGAFSGRLPFVLFSVEPRAPFQLSFLSKHVVRVALYSAHWPPIWLPWLLSHWSGSQTASWPLVLRLLASAEFQLHWTSLPRLIISRTIWSEWTRSRWSPWLTAGCPLSAQ